MAEKDADFAKPILHAAVEVACALSANALFGYAGAIDDIPAFLKTVKEPTKLILVCRDKEEEEQAKQLGVASIAVPDFDLTRMAQIKMATLIAFSQQVLKGNDVFIFLSGLTGESIDTMVVMRVGQEYELFQSVGQPKLTEHIRREVFQRVLTITLELAHEGREGKPVGALFVVGHHRSVQKFCREGRINPFRGYTDKERNILDESMTETVKEIAKLDGAFVIKGNGVITSAGTTLVPPSSGELTLQGFGSRHAAAAGITANTHSIAISLSESTGTVRIWRRGQMITEIEKAIRATTPSLPPPV